MPPSFPAIVPGAYWDLDIYCCFKGRGWREGGGTCFYEITWAADWRSGGCEVGG